MRNDENEARELLRLAQARFSSLIRSLPVGIAIVSGEGLIEAANPCALALLGYDETELVKHSLHMLLVKPPWSDDLKSWFEANPNATVELEAKAKDGERVRIDLSVRLLDADAHGRFVVVIQDVSRRFLAEQSKLQFYRMINHDLRSPLTAVGLFLESLAQSDSSAQLRDDERFRLTAARTNVERVVALVHGLLEIDRMDSGHSELRRERLSVDKLLDQAVTGTQELAGQKNVRITCHAESLFVQADRQRLLEVVINLLSNAIEHSPAGQIVEISARLRGKRVRVEVRDHGYGIAQDDQQQIFEQFQQASQHQGRGFGLGLFICRRLIEQHGGAIGCENAPGGGTTFWFELPVTHEVADH